VAQVVPENASMGVEKWYALESGVAPPT
jgi:hypothetical protein